MSLRPYLLAAALAAVAANARAADGLDPSQMQRFRDGIGACWNLPPAAMGAAPVTLHALVTPQRTLESVTPPDPAQIGDDPARAALVASAVRALRNPRCQPYALPEDGYAVWHELTVTFAPDAP